MKDWKEELSDLKCINGAMYFGAVEEPCSGRDTGECCHNEQTYEEALEELQKFIQALLDKQKQDIVTAINNSDKNFGITDKKGKGGTMLIDDVIEIINKI
jgi:phosphosulfolactate synthase (CoM biosynthesis protein A)